MAHLSDRYSRQILLSQIGPSGQARLEAANVALVGCGALGTVIAETLVRAGVGDLSICDRDFVERNNLQRQVLFDEHDVAEHLPKAEAAANKLRRINPDVAIRPFVVDVNHKNVERLTAGSDLILDGTDNFEARYLINDLAVATKRPWVYGAVLGSNGLCMAIIPHETPCLRCVFDTPPPSEVNPTCESAGVLGPAVNLVASFQSVEAIKILTGQSDALIRALLHIDAWTGRVVPMNVQSALDKGACVCCGGGQFDYLTGGKGSRTTSLCGRNAVQIAVSDERAVDLNAMAEKLDSVEGMALKRNAFLLCAIVEDFELTLFQDGRAIVKGTDDEGVARSLYAKYFGA